MELALLLGAVSSILLEAYKWLSGRFGKEATNRAMYIGMFALALGWTMLLQQNLISVEAANHFVETLVASVGVYEIIIKNLKKLVSAK